MLCITSISNVANSDYWIITKNYDITDHTFIISGYKPKEYDLYRFGIVITSYSGDTKEADRKNNTHLKMCILWQKPSGFKLF